MTRLQKFYDKTARAITDCYTDDTTVEPFGEWLERIGVTEAEDAAGAYGDEDPTWGGTPPEADLI